MNFVIFFCVRREPCVKGGLEELEVMELVSGGADGSNGNDRSNGSRSVFSYNGALVVVLVVVVYVV